MEHTWDRLDRPFSLRPLGKKVVVKWVDPPEKVGNILMPQSAKSNRYRATVIALGPEVDKLQADDVGKMVITQLYTAEVAIGREGDPDRHNELAVMDQDSILAVVEFAEIAAPRRGR